MKQTQKDKKMAKLRLHGNISKKSNDHNYFQYTVKAYSLNPLNPKSAKYLISPYNITPGSHI